MSKSNHRKLCFNLSYDFVRIGHYWAKLSMIWLRHGVSKVRRHVSKYFDQLSITFYLWHITSKSLEVKPSIAKLRRILSKIGTTATLWLQILLILAKKSKKNCHFAMSLWWTSTICVEVLRSTFYRVETIKRNGRNLKFLHDFHYSRADFCTRPFYTNL